MSILDSVLSFFNSQGKNSMAKINNLRVGESLVGEGNEIAHIDLIIGPRGSAAETAFATALQTTKMVFQLC